MTEVVSRAALLERKQEHDVFRQGHRFLDEKRVLVAQEILRRLADWNDLTAESTASLSRCRKAMADAIYLHGLEELQAQPRADLDVAPEAPDDHSFLGVPIRRDVPELEPGAPPDGPASSGAARACAAAFQELLGHYAELAVAAANLERLGRDYTRTERRARALEDVLLPELADEIRGLDEALEELERDEVSGLRWFGRR